MSSKMKSFKKKLLKNAKLLRYPAEELESVSSDLKSLDNILEIKDALRKVNILEQGIGVAAPQIGINKRVFYYNIPGDKKASQKEDYLDRRGIMINPTIRTSGELEPMNEGCLSIPGYFWEVHRPSKVWCEWIDQNGTECGEAFGGIMARLIQHEIDHLDGKLVIDYLNDEDFDQFVEYYINDDVKGYAPGGPIYLGINETS